MNKTQDMNKTLFLLHNIPYCTRVLPSSYSSGLNLTTGVEEEEE